jgi:hypothetical protein
MPSINRHEYIIFFSTFAIFACAQCSLHPLPSACWARLWLCTTFIVTSYINVGPYSSLLASEASIQHYTAETSVTCRPVDNKPPLKPAASCLTSPKRPKSPYPCTHSIPEEPVQGAPFFLFNNKSYIRSQLNLILSNSKHRPLDWTCLLLLPTFPRLLLALASAGSRSRRLFASRPEPHYLETSISTPRVLSHAASTLTVVTQSVSVSIWTTTLTTILLPSFCGQLRKAASPCQQAPF